MKIPYVFLAIPYELATEDFLKDPIMMRFVFWMMRRISTKKNYVPLKNRRRQLELAPFEFMFGRKACAKEAGISDRNVRTRVEQLLALGYISKVKEKSTSSFSVFCLEVGVFRQNSDQQQGLKRDQQIDSPVAHNLKAKISDDKIREASSANDGAQSVDNSPLSEKEKEDLQAIVNACKRKGIEIQKNVMFRWFRAYGVERIISHVGLLIEKKKQVKKPEAWLETALRENYVKQNQNIIENRLFAEQFKAENNWVDLDITKAYCVHKPSSKDYQFTLPIDDFRKMLIDCYNLHKEN